MKALIMAAGYGTRLEPLTLAVPKPMAPIVNLPTMQHNLELLKRHGITEIIANIHYHPEQIQNYFGSAGRLGVNLSYSYEEKLLGTAGGVKRMAKILEVKETFVVLSSDALTDINLGKMIAQHKKRRALVTMALAEVEDVSGFGVVIKEPSDLITGFQEKPRPEEAKSKLVNAGIYVIEPQVLKMIPDGPYDFGRQLFPELVAAKQALYGYQMVEYWSDVGGLDKYIQANFDALKGSIRIRVPGKKTGSATWLGERCRVDKSARFEGGVVIGDSTRIGKNVYVKDSVIGDKCVLADGAVVTGSVVWSDTVIGRDARVSQSVLGNWCHVGEGAKIVDGSVIANRCVVGKGVEVKPRTNLKPLTEI